MMQVFADDVAVSRPPERSAKKETVAVVIPTYNHAHFLAEADNERSGADPTSRRDHCG